MADPGMFRTPPLQGWQRTNVIAAANYLRDQLARAPDDSKLRAAYEGLLDLLDPSRMVARRQRELAEAAKQAASAVKHERRHEARRRGERRRSGAAAPGVDRRRGADRRSGRDRRQRS